MIIHDITLAIHPAMPVWPGDPSVVLERVSKIEEGANANVSRMSLSVHTGTHLDAPVHFLPGTSGVDTLPLEILVGVAQVFHLSDEVSEINAEVMAQAGVKKGHKRVLFRTRNSQIWERGEMDFQKDFVAIPLSGAQYLADLQVGLVGVDYLSVSPFKKSRPTHEALLKAGMVILEGLDLHAIPAGTYQLLALPLKLAGCDGSPARALLVED